MRRKQLLKTFIGGYSTDIGAYVHDHFSGSAHCLECGGHCQLNGPAIALTALIRWLFESELSGQSIPYPVERQLKESGIHVERFRERAKGASQ